MVPKFCVFALLALCALIKPSAAEDCREPLSVTNLTLDTDHFLSWSVREEEVCNVTDFLVDIFHRNQSVDYAFLINETRLDVSFLGVCQEWVFVVVPIAESLLFGKEQRLVTTLPLPTDANLTITSINITRRGPLMEQHLEWDLVDAHLGNCSLQFRLTVEVEGNPYIEDIILSEKSINLRFLAPCANYLFGVRAINIGYPTIEGPLRAQEYYISPGVQGPPRLISVTPDYNGFNSTWMVESSSRNACPVRSLYLDGSVLFRTIVDLDDSYNRGPINVTVTGLQANTMYYFNALLINSAGYSHPTPAAVQTLSFAQD